MKALENRERGSAGQYQGAAMKKGWETTQLSAVAAVQSGAGFPDRYQGQSDGEIPFYKVSDMNIAGNEREMVFENNSIAEEVRRELGAFLFPQGSTIFPKIGGAIATNKKRLTTRACCVDNNVMGVIPNPGKINSEFLFYFFLAHDLSEFANEAHLPSIRKTVVEEWPITLPVSLAEQQRIVGLLDEAFEGLATSKANAAKNLQNARALFESHLPSVFTQRGPGWVEKPFEECIEDVKYTAKIQRKEFLEEGQFPIVSQEAEFTNGYWDNAADVFKVTRPIVVFGDHTQVLKYIDFDFVLGADGVKLLPPKLFLNPKFFFYALRSAPLKSLGYARHYRLLKELQICYPDTNTQVVIAKKIDDLHEQTQRLARLYERKLAALEALKKSLLHRAFSGEM